MNASFYLLPVLSAILGWLINRSFSRYLLYRYLPTRQEQIIDSIGNKAAQLISTEKIESYLADPTLIGKAMPMIEKHIDEFLSVKLPQQIPMLSMFVGNKTTDKIKEVFVDQLQQLFPKVMTEIVTHAQDKFDIKTFVINELSSNDAITQTKNALASPLQKLQYIGLLSGFLIGIVNVLLLLLLM
ncbi:hypothetical protein [Niabella digestorum]|jgi:hypothetical protein|uniref:DUF445 family protein n=1 Tax=Niabella digestorum TaxID=3117701 RepID=A0ABU7RFJ6_9BACT